MPCSSPNPASEVEIILQSTRRPLTPKARPAHGRRHPGGRCPGSRTRRAGGAARPAVPAVRDGTGWPGRSHRARARHRRRRRGGARRPHPVRGPPGGWRMVQPRGAAALGWRRGCDEADARPVSPCPLTRGHTPPRAGPACDRLRRVPDRCQVRNAPPAEPPSPRPDPAPGGWPRSRRAWRRRRRDSAAAPLPTLAPRPHRPPGAGAGRPRRRWT